MDSGSEQDIEEIPGVVNVNESDEETTEQREQGEENRDEENDDDDANAERKKVPVPKRVVRNPQPKLNAETLKGARGLVAMPELFMKQKFKGKGHEEEDLRVLMKTYEYWCHRLFPKYPFDASIAKIETLGYKKPVITLIKKIRMGLMEEEKQNEIINSEDEDATPAVVEPSAADLQFDRLIERSQVTEEKATEEQLERMRISRENALKKRLQRIQQQAQANLGESSRLPAEKSNDILKVVEEQMEIQTESDFSSGYTNEETRIASDPEIEESRSNCETEERTSLNIESQSDTTKLDIVDQLESCKESSADIEMEGNSV